MPKTKIHLASNASGDKPYDSVKRQLRSINLGLYCSGCDEFFALAVAPPSKPPLDIEYVADGPLLFECPFCHQRQIREVSEITTIRLTEGNKRRPQRPPGLH